MPRRACGFVVLSAALALAAAGALAGGPRFVRPNGAPFVWDTSVPIAYRTDNGPLSASVAEAAARGRVLAMFNIWQDVASATISYTRAGFINDAGAFTDGDVSTLAEYDAVLGDCSANNQNPVIYDAAAAIIIALNDDEQTLIGFAGTCSLDTSAGQIENGQVLMNGLFQDGVDTADNPELTAAQFDATFIHEFGHFSGLDHSQINVECADGSCSNDNFAGLPTMFPFLVNSAQSTLSIDDIAWISRLYPAAGGSGFAATHGTITGTVYFSDGESQAQLVNVVARLVDNSRTMAVSSVSGYKFRFFHGNPINEPQGDPFGTVSPSDIGLYEIFLPPGNYTIEVESIDPEFEEGSSVGGPIRIAMPGTAPAPIGPINVTAGATSSGHDVTLIGTDPRFDQFEGP